jgi:Putative transposase
MACYRNGIRLQKSREFPAIEKPIDSPRMCLGRRRRSSGTNSCVSVSLGYLRGRNTSYSEANSWPGYVNCSLPKSCTWSIRHSRHLQRAPHWFSLLYSERWVVYAKRPFAGPQQVLSYLGNYTHRIALLLSCVRASIERVLAEGVLYGTDPLLTIFTRRHWLGHSAASPGCGVHTARSPDKTSIV